MKGTEFTPAEAQSLPIHVAACAERYRTLFQRMGRIESVLLWIAAGVGTLCFTVIGGVLIALINKGIHG